jgi:PAS domain S-box-containing protein
MKYRKNTPYPALVRPDSPAQVVAVICIVAVVCYLAAKLGGALAIRPEMIWPVWPGCAFLVAALLLIPRKIWPWVLTAGLSGFALYDLQEHVTLRATAFLLVADFIEILVASLGVSYLFRGVPRLNSVQALIKYSIFAVILAPVSVASAAATALERDSWWVGFFTEALALLTLTPAILGWTHVALTRTRAKTPYVEGILLCAGLTTLAYLAFLTEASSSRPALLYSLVPFLLWAALRFGITGASSSMVIVCFLATMGVTHGRGPFAGNTPLKDVLALQLFLLVASCSFMVLAAVVEGHNAVEQSVRESEERFRLAAHAGKMFAYEWDAATDKVARSGDCAEVLGVTETAAFTGAQILAKVHPADRQKLTNALAQLSPQKPYLQISYRMLRADGSVIWVERNSQAYFDDHGKISRIAGLVANITERMEAEEARFRQAAIIESSEDAIISGTLDGIIVSWNSGAQKIYGYTEAEAVGKSITILVPPDLPEEENKVLEALRAGDRVEHFETVRLTKTGKRIDVSLTISPIRDSCGKTVGISGIARDITERKLGEQAVRENEQRFRLAAQAGKMYSFDWDVSTNVVVRSPERIKVLGAAEPLRSSHQQFVDTIYQEDRPRFIATIAGLRPENPTAEVIFRVRSSDGALIWLKSSGCGFFDSEGRLRRVIGMVADINDLKRAEESLSVMSRKLIEAQEQERGRIGRELHDDINQRLALLTVQLQSLEQDPAQLQERLQGLQKQTAEISNDVQALSHELHSSKLEYLGVVPGIRSWCREFSERQGMAVRFTSDVNTPVTHEIGVTLFRILQEALHNAAKHSGVKEIHVQLSEQSTEIHLRISDAGKGFDLEAARQSRGLGLASMEERARLVDGTLTIDTEPTRGTTIRVRVPFMPEHVTQRAAS